MADRPMDTTDPLPPDGSARPEDPPDLVRVGRPGRPRPTIAVVVAAALLFALAVWKPWDSGASPARAPSTVPPDAAGALLPAITSRPDDAARRRPRPRRRRRRIAGLDLSSDGNCRSARRLGSRRRIPCRRSSSTSRRTARRSSPQPPAGSPSSRARPRRDPSSIAPGGTSVAIAATWPALPSAEEPVSLRLFRYLPAERGPSSGPPAHRWPKPRSGSGPRWTRSSGPAAAATPAATLGSGRFFIPSGAVRGRGGLAEYRLAGELAEPRLARRQVRVPGRPH